IVDRWYRSFELDDTNLGGNLEDVKVEMLDAINREIGRASAGQGDTENQEAPVRRLPFLTWNTFSRIAAIFLLGTACAIFFYKRAIYPARTEVSSAVSDDMNDDKATAAEAPSTLYLSDGTVVWLKEGSRLEYPEVFQGKTREVTLTGEAFFDVSKNPGKPFVIHSANFTTRVLGTTFNIKAYGNEDSGEVVVVTGRVVVAVNEPSPGKAREVVLHPNEKAVYSKKNNSLMETAAAESEKKIASGKDRLLFDETSLEDIITVLNATYGVNISVSGETMKRCIVTADLSRETLDADIEILSKAVNATYEIAGKDIILRGNGCGQ
ncbi:MAG TPA: FecR family protein, partial [Chryseosolibacter sp.]